MTPLNSLALLARGRGSSAGLTSWHPCCRELVGPHPPHLVLIGYGAARFLSTSRGQEPGAVRHFRWVLRQFGHLIEVDEFRTSITCSSCLAPTVSGRMPVRGLHGHPSEEQVKRMPVKQYQVSCSAVLAWGTTPGMLHHCRQRALDCWQCCMLPAIAQAWTQPAGPCALVGAVTPLKPAQSLLQPIGRKKCLLPDCCSGAAPLAQADPVQHLTNNVWCCAAMHKHELPPALAPGPERRKEHAHGPAGKRGEYPQAPSLLQGAQACQACAQAACTLPPACVAQAVL